MSGERLVVTSRFGAGRKIAVGDELLLGRGAPGVDALSEDPKLSRRHALVERDPGGQVTIKDLESANGTYVNGVKIQGSVHLEEGDVIRIGSTTLRLEVERERPRLSASTIQMGSPSPPATSILANPRAPSKAPAQPPTPAVPDQYVEPAVFPQPIEQIGSPSAIAPIYELTGARILYEGRTIPVLGEEMTIGRATTNDLVLKSDKASREHARIVARDDRYYLEDLGSQNGTYLNGERLLSEARWLNSGDAIVIGGESIRFLATSETSAPPDLQNSVRTILTRERPLTFGRDPRNDVQLDATSVSRFHAEAVPVPGGYEIRDLGSRNGMRINGAVVRKATVTTGDEIGIGPYRLIYDGSSFTQRDDRGVLRLDAFAASIDVRGKALLNRATLSVEPGELVALIGESGAGKSTLLKALSGVQPISSGSVTLNGEPVSTRLADIGYLPQDEIVHPRLTVEESLRFSARLRLPGDASRGEIEETVDRVLTEVSLNEHRRTRIGSLSGGQRKRVGLAMELLNRPGILFLDEPTTGLDPGLETRMMELFRDLAAIGRQAIVIATHATKNLDLVDKLCVIGRGGEICYFGPPEGAKAFFGTTSYDEVYGKLETRCASDWRAEFDSRAERANRPLDVGIAPSSSRRRPVPFLAQATILARRYLKVFTRDARNLAILLAQAPLLALATALLFKHDVFALRTGKEAAGTASPVSQVIFLMVTVTIWLGTIDSAREVIKERAIFIRERAAGVRVSAYLASKAIFLFLLCAIQAAALTAVVFALRPLNGQHLVKTSVLVELVGTGLVAVAMGLLISSVSRSQDQATALIPIAMVIQLLFGGAIVTVKSMGRVMAGFASVIFSRWSFAGVGTTIDMKSRIGADTLFRKSNSYGSGFFTMPLTSTIVVMSVFLIVFLLGSAFLLSRQRE
jgi:ABC-type multidrug transport system ATPase subunit/pSer/pThr/pTyr-binding forkhead associated (FHA) protein